LPADVIAFPVGKFPVPFCASEDHSDGFVLRRASAFCPVSRAGGVLGCGRTNAGEFAEGNGGGILGCFHFRIWLGDSIFKEMKLS
jgi:hypothetical protein